MPPQAAMPCVPLSNAPDTLIQASRKRSISNSVVLQPRLRRMAPRASAGATPIAASTCAALLAAARDEGIEMDGLVALDECADPLGGADLVPRKGQKIGSNLIDITGNSPGRLDRVDVQQAARRLRHASCLGNRLND